MISSETPVFKNNSGEYEISSEKQLLYFSNHLAKEIPRTAVARLTCDLDMTAISGFLPIGRRKETSFRGTFYGDGHLIKNLKIVMPGKKNVALFGYLGDDCHDGEIFELGVVDFHYSGAKNIGGLTGVNYGLVERCFVTGTIDGECSTSAMGIGGLTGKNHRREDGASGLYKNCYANVDITASYAVGGLSGKDEGGYMENCYAAGTVKACHPNGQAGGIFGAFIGGEGAKNCVTMVKSVWAEKDADKTVGQLEDESGQQMSGILAWDGMRVHGLPPAEQNFKWTDVSAEVLQNKQTWENLNWDFEHVWEWSDGYPILRAFGKEKQKMTFDFSVDAAINTRAISVVPVGKPTQITAKVVTSGKIERVTLYYKNSDYPQAVEMCGENGVYTGEIPPQVQDFSYAIVAKTDLDEVGAERWYQVKADNGEIDAAPERICLNISETNDKRRVNWVTDPRISASVAEFRKRGERTWQSVTGTSTVLSVTPGFKALSSHKAELFGLEAGETYEYRVGDGETMSDILTFTVFDPKDSFGFIFASDSQSVTVEDYATYVRCMNWALAHNNDIAFAAMGGDISQDGYKSTQWAAFFEAAGKMFSELTFVPVLGNHDMKSDHEFVQFRTHFNLPDNGIKGKYEGVNYKFSLGNAEFFVLVTEAKREAEFYDMMAKQLVWLEAEAEKSDKRWKIVLMHSGPYTSNHDDTRVRKLVTTVFEKLKIDLVLGGHDHLYVRTTMLGDKKVPVNSGITYVTAGTVGNKFYDWLPESEWYTEVYKDEFDRQIFCVVRVRENAVEVEAWQKNNPKDKACTQFSLCDKFTLY